MERMICEKQNSRSDAQPAKHGRTGRTRTPSAQWATPIAAKCCGMWVKFKEENGKKVIDRATFQSFGCETAIAVASLATELIRGKTADEALALKGEELAGELGPLPPMKIHCAQLVEGALRSAFADKPANETHPTSAQPKSPTLMDSLATGEKKVKIKILQ